MVNVKSVTARYLATAMACAILSVAPIALATTLSLQPISFMTTRCDAVVRATPIPDSTTSFWGREGNIIFSQTRFRVIESYMGDLPEAGEVSIVTLGGIIGDVQLSIPGTPQFRPDEEVVLFLWNDAYLGGRLRVVDLAAGKFEIAAVNGQTVVARRDLANIEIVGEQPAPIRTLETLKAEIRQGVALKKANANAKKGGDQ